MFVSLLTRRHPSLLVRYSSRRAKRPSQHVPAPPPPPDRYVSLGHTSYISQTTNPYFNLAFEDWLFKYQDIKKPVLFVYQDDPCVVIGRNQNPWKEINFDLMAEKDILFVRRRSGGGTVYHDLGNVNFSIHVPREVFDRKMTGEIVIRALQSLNIDAYVNERNDISVGGKKICSAYKIVKDRAYHHGTMLISSKLEDLGGVLRSNKDTMITRGVASVPSPVTNLCEYNENITPRQFTEAVVDAFKTHFKIKQPICSVSFDKSAMRTNSIRSGILELGSWNWMFGQTPEFTYTLSKEFDWGTVDAAFNSKHGDILSCALSLSSFSSTASLPRSDVEHILERLRTELKGHKYGFLKVRDLTSGIIPPSFDGFKRFSDYKQLAEEQLYLPAIDMRVVANIEQPLKPREIPTKAKSKAKKTPPKDQDEGKKDHSVDSAIQVLESRMKERVRVVKEVLDWLMRDMRTEWGNSMQLMRRPPKLMRKDILGLRSDNSPKKVPRLRDKNGYFIDEKKS